MHKNGLDVGEDLSFFFLALPKFGQKNGLILSEDLYFGLYYSQISWSPTPLFENRASARFYEPFSACKLNAHMLSSVANYFVLSRKE